LKGPYYRLVGRFTQRYLRRAAGKSDNEIQKRLLFIAAAGADDYFSKIFNVQSKSAQLFPKIAIEKKLRKQQINTAFHIYLSTLLILLGNHRDQLLKETGLSEAGWIQLWCSVFEYHAEDMEHYNKELLPAYQDMRLDTLAKSATSLILASLSCASSELLFVKESILEETLAKDISAVLRVLCSEKGA